MKLRAYVIHSLCVFVCAVGGGATAPAQTMSVMAAVPAARFTPLYSPDTTRPTPALMAAFRMDRRPVTNAEYAAFVAKHPDWARNRAPTLFHDAGYLRQWATPTRPFADDARRPVVNVSWYAARAFCRAQGKRLPMEMEWELAASAGRERADMRDEPAVQRELLAWYAAPTAARLPEVGRGKPNYWGFFDLHTLVWEWVEDFNASLTTGDNRAADDGDRALFCGGTAGLAGDRADYAAYQRFALRSSLLPAYTGRNLGFRCAADEGVEP